MRIDKKNFELFRTIESGVQRIEKVVFYKKDYKVFLDNKLIIDPIEELKIVNSIKLENFLYRYDKSHLTLTIAPTTHCNFKCIYCYEENLVAKKMSTNIENKIIDFIKSKSDTRSLNISWFGGEPLLDLRRIESITKKILDLDLYYNASMTTNGFLLNENVIKKLKELRISYLQITLDGLEETHNIRRPLKQNGNSFRKIIENLTLLMQIAPEIKVNIRINIDKSNENELPIFYAFLQDKFKNKYFITPAFVVSESINYSDCLASRYDKSIFELAHKFLPIVNFYPLHRPSECMARRINSYLIDPEGNLFKCYEDIGKIEKRIASLINKGINSTIMTDYLVGEDPLSDEECLNCKLFPLCNGGCPYIRLSKKAKKDYCITMKGFEKEFILAHLYQKREFEIKQ